MKNYMVIVLFFGLLTSKAFSKTHAIVSAGYAKTDYIATTSNTPTINIDAYVPVFLDNLYVGLGVGYLYANFAKQSAMLTNFNILGNGSENDVKVSLIPTYLSAKYEYVFHKNAAIFFESRIGITIGNKNYYSYTSLQNSNGLWDQDSRRDRAELQAKVLYGGSVGMKFYDNYLVSLHYESINMENKYYKEQYIVDNSDRFWNMESSSVAKNRLSVIGLRVAYIFGSK